MRSPMTLPMAMTGDHQQRQDHHFQVEEAGNALCHDAPGGNEEEIDQQRGAADGDAFGRGQEEQDDRRAAHGRGAIQQP